MVRIELCNYRRPPYIIDEEGRGMEVGAISTACLSTIERSLMRCASLLFPNPKLPYIVVANTSSFAASGVLMQDQLDGL